jgi:2-polyprenyl-3-methyl-5-hydroxy-6-metoxy-1,4-benzoquinol methylase
MEKTYLKELEKLKKLADTIPNTPMMVKAKIQAMITMNMRYERLMVDRKLKEHPYKATEAIVAGTATILSAWKEVSFIEDPDAVVLERSAKDMEKNHQALFQILWQKFSPEEYIDRIARYAYRLKINGLADGFLKGKRCIDFGCGHGNFAHALLKAGAEYAQGVDYGVNSIKYAKAAALRLKVPASKLEFKHESVYKVSAKSGSFDFAIQNGVFHHLDDEDKAYKEVHRVLKPGGWFWIYTDGQGAISHDLWDASLFVLRRVPSEYTVEVLGGIGLSVGKLYHLSDGLNAVYRHATWESLTKRLSKLGFGNYKRLKGGYPTDFDHDVIAADRWGKAKFGSGDLRLLAQKL